MESSLSIKYYVESMFCRTRIGFHIWRANLLKKCKVFLCTGLVVWPAVRPSVRAFVIHDHDIICARWDKTRLMRTKEKSGQAVTSLQTSKVWVPEVGGRLGEIVDPIHHVHANAMGTSWAQGFCAPPPKKWSHQLTCRAGAFLVLLGANSVVGRRFDISKTQMRAV